MSYRSHVTFLQSPGFGSVDKRPADRLDSQPVAAVLPAPEVLVGQDKTTSDVMMLTWGHANKEELGLLRTAPNKREYVAMFLVFRWLQRRFWSTVFSRCGSRLANCAPGNSPSLTRACLRTSWTFQYLSGPRLLIQHDKVRKTIFVFQAPTSPQ